MIELRKRFVECPCFAVLVYLCFPSLRYRREDTSPVDYYQMIIYPGRQLFGVVKAQGTGLINRSLQVIENLRHFRHVSRFVLCQTEILADAEQREEAMGKRSSW